MAYLLKKDGKLVLRDGLLVTVPNASGNEDCECCGGEPCADCAGTQSSVSIVQSGQDCVPNIFCPSASTTGNWSSFSTSGGLCIWTWTNNVAGLDRNLVVVHNPTASAIAWAVGCGASIPAGGWYVQYAINFTAAGVIIRWNKLGVSVTCSGGELSFSDSLTICSQSGIACSCGIVTVTK